METTLYKGSRVQIQQSKRAISRSKRDKGKWTKDMPILDVVIHGNGMRVVRADHLNKFFTPGKLSKKALFPLELETYQRKKGATAYLQSDRGTRREPIEPGILIPPLCGISKNQYARNVRRRL